MSTTFCNPHPSPNPVPEISSPPARWSWPWYCAQFNSWWEQPTQHKFVQALGGLLFTMVLWKYSYKFFFGWYFYWWNFAKAAIGDDLIVESCARIIKELHPWWDLPNDDYFKFSRCVGNEHGFRWQGELTPSLGEIIEWLFNPFIFSSWVRMIVVLLFFYYLVPLIWRKFCVVVFSLWSFASNTRVTYCWILSATFWSRKNGWVFSPFALNNLMQWTRRCQCLHIDPCECFSSRDAENAALLQQIRLQINDINVLRAALVSTEDRLAEAETNFDVANKYSWHQAGKTAPPISTYGPRYDRLQYELQHAIQRIATVEREKDDLIQEIQNQTLQYHARVEKLQAQVNYARGAGEEMSAAQKELEDMKAKNRTLEREKTNLIIAGMQTRQALAKEKEMHSLRCQDEAGCQTKLADLQYKCKKLMDSHIYNDKMVFEAALKFGMPKEEAQHVTLLSYVSQVTIELARLKALGVRGSTNTVDFQVKNLQDELERTVSLKNRLEREVDRLGGDVMGIRNGWDTTRPKDWTVALDTTYEQNAYRIFPIYEKLCETLNALTNVFTTVGLDPPIWEPEKARNDQTYENYPGFQLEPHQLAISNKITNPMAENSDILTHKLTVAEMQRLYNRGLQLSVDIQKLAMKRERAEPGTVDPAVVIILENADKVFKDVIHEALDDIRPLIRLPTDQSPDTRREKKFEIYTAMQQSITALTNCILMNDRTPPAWIAPFEQSSRFWSSPDNLALNLINTEMKTLESRINQLLVFMNHYKLPGTLNGGPLTHLQNDPDYVQRWYELVASTGFARLTLSHWHLHLDQRIIQIPDEHGNLKTEIHPQVTLLPLKHDKYLSAVLHRGESEEEKRQRELAEGAWPDNLEPVLLLDPIVGPKIEFKIIDLNSPTRTNNSKYPNDSDNKNKNFKGNDYETLRKFWETKRQRIEQLKNHIIQWGIRDNIALPNVSQPLRKNAEVEFIKRSNEIFDQQINMLTNHIGNHVRSDGQKYQVPKMVHKGGKMFPTF